jgi:hypothetical protein
MQEKAMDKLATFQMLCALPNNVSESDDFKDFCRVLRRDFHVPARKALQKRGLVFFFTLRFSLLFFGEKHFCLFAEFFLKRKIIQMQS